MPTSFITGKYSGMYTATGWLNVKHGGISYQM